MKNILFIVASSIVFFSCNQSDLHQVWIGTHYYDKQGDLNNHLPREIYYFENDSVTIKAFYK